MIYFESTISKDVRKYCAEIGKNRLLVQGAGGNVSWKDGDILWIKSSGSWLEDAESKEIFIPVDLKQIRKSIDSDFISLDPKVVGKSTGRPSIETSLHALLPQKIVIHLHAIEVLARLIRNDANEIIHKCIGDSLSWCFVEYFKPGIELAKAVKSAITHAPEVNVIFMKNHGLVIGVDSIAEAKHLTKKILNLLESKKKKFTISNYSRSECEYYAPIFDKEIHLLATEPCLFNCVKNKWPICPDHVVFLGPMAYCFSNWQDFHSRNFSIDLLPELIFIENTGVYSLDSFGTQNYLQLRGYLDALVRQSDLSIIEALDDESVSDLINWDAEKFRKGMVK